MTAVNPVVDLSLDGSVAVIIVDSRPVNALSHAVREGIIAAVGKAGSLPEVAAIVLLCGGRTYFAGFDIAEFDSGILDPDLLAVCRVLEESKTPIVTGIHGTALGGGLETALACHWRVAVPSAKLGLPEVHLGLLPASGGTQRLPRIVGAEKALDMMIGGRPIAGPQALALGIVDELAGEGSLREDTIAFARTIAGRPDPRPRIRDRRDWTMRDAADPGLFDRFVAAQGARLSGVNAPAAIVTAVRAAVQQPFDEGMAEEARLFRDLCNDDQSPALRYSFFAEREAARIPGIGPDIAARPVGKVGVVGAGTMGTGIALAFLGAGLPVRLVEVGADALDRGVATIRRTLEASAAKGHMAHADVQATLACLAPGLSIDDLGDCDLIVEAVFESLAVKQSVFRDLDRIAGPQAILASNTSFLDLDAIAAVTSRPGSVVGLHFFSPANIMKMLEVVRGRKTDPAVLVTAMAVARRIGKVAVVTGVCHGFIANRIFDKRQRMAERLLLEGATPSDVDRVAVGTGFPMGPFAMMDLVGLDVIGWDRTSTASRNVIEILNEAGRHGQKSGHGYFDYDEKRRPSPSAFTDEAIRRIAARQGIERRTLADQEIADRLLYPMIREAVLILEEGIALRASDIDVAVQYGYGWPRYRGGPMYEADRMGAAELVRRLEGLAERFGDDLAPTGLMRRLARDGGTFRDPAAAR